MKTFTEVVESKLSGIFSAISTKPEYTGYLTNGLPIGIAVHLKRLMLEEKKPEVSIKFGDLCEFSLKANKKGDAVAFLPEFKILDGGQKMIDSDDVNVTRAILTDYTFAAKNNEELINFAKDAKYAMEGWIYSDNKWVNPETPKISDDDYNGINLPEPTDVLMTTFCIITSIIEILANNKDQSADITYTIDGFGTFTVKPVKNGYTVSLTFEKEFKQNAKDDKLTEVIASILE